VEDFPEGKREDASASVTLKDGTTRVGPWREGKPVGDWWKTHELIVGGSITQQAEQSALAVTSKKIYGRVDYKSYRRKASTGQFTE
jgi:hypothetical protein